MSLVVGLGARLRLPRLTRALPRSVWLLLGLALVLRVGVVAATYDQSLTLDAADFSRSGLAIAQGHGYPNSNRAPGGGPSAFRPPAYPFLLAGVYWVAGQEAPPAGRVIGAILGVLSVGFVGLIARRLWGSRVGLIALGIAAIAPPMVVMSTALVSEALFVPLILASVLCALEARDSPRPLAWAAATGALIGLAELTRTNAAVLLLPLGLAIWRRPRLRLSALRALAVLVAAAALVVAPWTIRNAIVMHAFVPVSTEVGYTIAGTYDNASRADQHWPAVWKEVEHGASPEYSPIVFAASIGHWGEVRLGDRLQAAAIADIKRHPTYPFKAAFYNFVRMFQLGELDFASGNLRDTDIERGPALIAIFGFYPLVALALAGLFTREARETPPWVWLVPVLLLLSALFVTSFLRFRASVDPFLAMLAALAVADFLRWREGRRRPQGAG